MENIKKLVLTIIASLPSDVFDETFTVEIYYEEYLSQILNSDADALYEYLLEVHSPLANDVKQ